ncbi:MAG: hypothetical protein ACAI34_06625 [Verrucomicrobium sp.]|nr:hypothetical protein [Verrucomicrobium sp.]
MNFPALLALATALLLPVISSACSSGKSNSKKTTSVKKDAMSQSMEERMGKFDMGKRSSFEKSVGTAGANKGFKTSDFHRQKDFHTGSQYSGGKDKFNAKNFAQSSKASKEGSKAFSGGNDRSNLGDTTFKTRESNISRDTVHDADKVSSQSDDTFRTFDNRMGTKGMENSKKPLIQDQPGQYSEGQIRSILNKG